MRSKWKSQSRFSKVKTEKVEEKEKGQNKDVENKSNQIKHESGSAGEDHIETEREEEKRHCAKQGYHRRRPSHLQREE